MTLFVVIKATVFTPGNSFLVSASFRVNARRTAEKPCLPDGTAWNKPVVVSALMLGMVLYRAVVLVVRKPWVGDSTKGRVVAQLPSPSAVTTARDCKTSTMPSASSRNTSTTQLGQELLSPLVPLTDNPLIAVTLAGRKSTKASGRLGPS